MLVFLWLILYYTWILIQSFSCLELSLLFFDLKSEIHLKIHFNEGSWFWHWLVGVKEISNFVSYLLLSRVVILQCLPFFFLFSFFKLVIVHLLDYYFFFPLLFLASFYPFISLFLSSLFFPLILYK